MVIAKISVNGTRAEVTELHDVPKGIVGATIEVQYGADWDGLTKTAVISGVVTKDVLDAGTSIEILPECVTTSGHRLRVGFYGVCAQNETAIPTLWADLGVIQNAADPSGDPSTDPALPVWAQVQKEIRELKETGGGKGEQGEPGKDGADGITPHIGANGNWYIGETDTGKPSRGESGKAGQDGYTPQKGVDYFDGLPGKDGVDGKDGSPGKDGIDGQPGKDGTSVTVTSVSESTVDGGSNVVQFSDGKTLTVKNGKTGEKGADGYTPQKGIDYFDGKDGSPGKNGADGKTPEKGVDYWTPADQEDIVQQVAILMGMHIVGVVDGENNIVLTGNLADGTYTLKYEDADGNVTDIGIIDTRPGYTNMLLLAVETDDTPYNGGQGWKTDTRLSSSGGESTSSATGMEVTGFIPFKRGDVIRFRGITMNRYSENNVRCYFVQYDSNKTMLKQWIVSGFNTEIEKGHVIKDADWNILQINTGDFDSEENTDAVASFFTNAAYFRISADEINADSVITINQEIV